MSELPELPPLKPAGLHLTANQRAALGLLRRVGHLEPVNGGWGHPETADVVHTLVVRALADLQLARRKRRYAVWCYVPAPLLLGLGPRTAHAVLELHALGPGEAPALCGATVGEGLVREWAGDAAVRCKACRRRLGLERRRGRPCSS